MSFLEKGKVGVWVVDVQDRLFPHIASGEDVLERMCLFLEGARHLELPWMVTEQYPKGLGRTLPALTELFPPGQHVFEKTLFSGYADPAARKGADQLGVAQWILVGIEAHVCILQTAKDLLAAGKEVIVLNDAIGSRSLYDFSTAIAELRDVGARITCVEAALYELVRDAASPQFPGVLESVKGHA